MAGKARRSAFKAARKAQKARGKGKSSGKNNKWRQYVGVSNAPIPY